MLSQRYAPPYSYKEMKKYDLPTALYQGTLFPYHDDHWRRRKRTQDEMAGGNV
jgi:hypothetical protein